MIEISIGNAVWTVIAIAAIAIAYLIGKIYGYHRGAQDQHVYLMGYIRDNLIKQGIDVTGMPKTAKELADYQWASRQGING